MATRMGCDGILTAVVKGGSRTELSGFKDCYTELSVVDGLLVPGERLVIPRELRVAVLEAAHEGCHGRDSMLHQLRVDTWWPGQTKGVKDWVIDVIAVLLVWTGTTQLLW